MTATTATTSRAARSTGSAGDAAARLAELTAELAGLPERIRQARRAGDAATYLQLEQRREDLPGEIREAEEAALAEELAAAEAALAEAQAAEEADQARLRAELDEATTAAEEAQAALVEAQQRRLRLLAELQDLRGSRTFEAWGRVTELRARLEGPPAPPGPDTLVLRAAVTRRLPDGRMWTCYPGTVPPPWFEVPNPAAWCTYAEFVERHPNHTPRPPAGRDLDGSVPATAAERADLSRLRLAELAQEGA